MKKRKQLIFDFSRVLIFPKDLSYKGGLNALYDRRSKENNFIFNDHFLLNEELLNFLEDVKEKHALCVFTTGHIQNAPDVKKRLSGIFKRVYSVEELSYGKNDPAAYRHILQELRCPPEESLYIDDSPSNIKTAKEAGLGTILFLDNAQLMQDFKNFEV